MASSTIGTNIVADEQALQELVSTLLNDIKRLLDYNVSTKKERLLKELYDRVSKGEKCVFNFIPQQFAERIEAALQDQNIPYHTIYGANGDIAFLVTDRDKDKLMEIQKEVMMTSTAYFAEAKASKVLDVSKKHGKEKGPVVRLSFKEGNREGFEFAKQQLYNNKIVSGVLDFENVEKERNNEKMEAEIYISTDDFFNSKGQDISKVELEYALHQTINGMEKKPEYKSQFAQDMGAYFKHKENKLKYDNEQMKEFAKQIKSGNRAVLGDITNGSEFFLQTEYGNLQIVSKSNGMWTPHEIAMDKDADLQSIVAVISSYTEHISNMHVYANVQEHDKNGKYRYDNWNPDVEMTNDEKLNAIKESGRVGYFNDELTQEEIHDIKRNVRQKYSEDLKNATSVEEKNKIKETIENEINEKIIEDTKNKPNKNLQNLLNIIKKDEIVKAELEKITETITKINKDASQYVAMKSPLKPLHEKYTDREILVTEALKNKNNEYIGFYLDGKMDKNEEPHLNREERILILEEIVKHYTNKHELGLNEMIVETVSNDKNLMNEVLQDEYIIEQSRNRKKYSKDDDKDKNREEEDKQTDNSRDNESDKQNEAEKDNAKENDKKDESDTQDENERDK